MRRKIIVLITAMMLVVGMVAATSLAGTKTKVQYGTTTAQLIKKYTNSGTSKTIYGHLSPAATSPAAYLTIWDSYESVIRDREMYFAYPPNTNNVSYVMGAYETVKLIVTPVSSGYYVWGEAEWWTS